MGRDDEGDRQVDHVGQTPVRQVALEPAEREHLEPRAVHGEGRGGPLRLEVDEVRCHEVLRRGAPVRGHLRPVDGERGLGGPEHRAQEPRALGSVERGEVAPDPREHAGGHRAHPSERGDGVLRVRGVHREGYVALAHEVGDALAHLRVEDVVVLLGQWPGRVVADLEEGAVADLGLVDGARDEGRLHGDLGREAVVEHAHALAHRRLGLVARRLVADVAEAVGSAVPAEVVHRDSVAEEREVGHGVRGPRPAPPPLRRPPPLPLLLLSGPVVLGLLPPEGWAHSPHRPFS